MDHNLRAIGDEPRHDVQDDARDFLMGQPIEHRL